MRDREAIVSVGGRRTREENIDISALLGLNIAAVGMRRSCGGIERFRANSSEEENDMCKRTTARIQVTKLKFDVLLLYLGTFHDSLTLFTITSQFRARLLSTLLHS